MQQTMIEKLLLTPLLEMSPGEITEAQMNRAGGKIPKMETGDKPVGRIEGDIPRRLYVASRDLAIKANRLLSEAETAPDDNAEQRLKEDAAETLALAKIMNKLFWFEAQHSLGVWGKSLKLREGWMLVEAKEDNGPPEILKRLFGGMGGE